jgi:hypothetical protein
MLLRRIYFSFESIFLLVHGYSKLLGQKSFCCGSGTCSVYVPGVELNSDLFVCKSITISPEHIINVERFTVCARFLLRFDSLPDKAALGVYVAIEAVYFHIQKSVFKTTTAYVSKCWLNKPAPSAVDQAPVFFLKLIWEETFKTKMCFAPNEVATDALSD